MQKLCAKVKGEKMANKKFLLGMLAAVLAFSMAVIGCDDGSDDDEDADPKKITITGLMGGEGTVTINLMDGDGTTVAAGEEPMANEVTFSLKKQGTATDWTGTGSYYVMLYITSGQNSMAFIYIEDESLQDLGVASKADMAKLPKYPISNTTSTIAFGKFIDVSDMMGD
jgi:hypothetical protein